MSDSHSFDPSSSPSFAAFQKVLDLRFNLPADEAAAQQPIFERELHSALAAVERDIHAADFARLDVTEPGLVVDGQRFLRLKGKTVGIIDTIAGKVSVKRSVYRARGGHGGQTICPLEMRLGLIDGRWTMAAAETASRFLASTTPKESAALLAQLSSMRPSPAHLDRLPKFVSEVWEQQRETFEKSLREAEAAQLPAPELVDKIMISLDGVMVPMKDAPRIPGLGKQDTGPKGHKEASSGTLTLFDAQEQRLHTIYLARMPESKKVILHNQLEAELRSLVRRYPKAQLVAVADGADENWRIIRAIGHKIQKNIKEVLDYFHAVEHIDVILRLHAGNNIQQLQGDISYWHQTLRDDRKGVNRVLSALAYRIKQAEANGEEAKKNEMTKHYNYIKKRKTMMAYAKCRELKIPIGSGIQEAACKTLVAQRMKNSGMSWRRPGGQAILTLRSLQHSGRLHEMWKILRPAFVINYRIDSDSCRLKQKRKAI